MTTWTADLRLRHVHCGHPCTVTGLVVIDTPHYGPRMYYRTTTGELVPVGYLVRQLGPR